MIRARNLRRAECRSVADLNADGIESSFVTLHCRAKDLPFVDPVAI